MSGKDTNSRKDTMSRKDSMSRKDAMSRKDTMGRKDSMSRKETVPLFLLTVFHSLKKYIKGKGKGKVIPIQARQ